jgi:hypothetical protein
MWNPRRTPPAFPSIRFSGLVAGLLAIALLLSVLLSSPKVQAGRDGENPEAVDPEKAKAERDRLLDEMEKLAKRAIWEGVEKKYRELERLGVPLEEKDHLAGAYASRELGDVGSTHERLWKALKAAKKEPKQVVDWLWDIDNHYGHVELVSIPPRGASLKATEMPFDPYQRKAVERAIESVEADGIFVGLLPEGSYDFSSQAFTVVAGISVRIEVSPRLRRQGLIEPVIRYPDDPGAAARGAPPPPPPEQPEAPPQGE